MAHQESWTDFEQIRHRIKNNTVDKLKQILTGLNEDCAGHYAKSGKKQELIDRIVAALDGFRVAGLEDKWLKAKAVIDQVRAQGTYTPARLSTLPPPSSTVAAGYPVDGVKPGPFAINGAPAVHHYDPYAPPRRPAAAITTAASSSAAHPPPIRFKESPFFRIDQNVSTVVECPESTSGSDRRSQHLSFTLTPEVLEKLATKGPWQLRLFCTSSMFFSGLNTFRRNSVPCPIEFPPTCEVRINGTQVTANLKGLKKKPGTAPPPDITPLSRHNQSTNRVEMIYVNSQTPVVPKKFYLVVMLVETTTIDAIIHNLKSNSYKSAADIQQQLAQDVNEDDDIVPGPQTMSLKCPLTFMRIETPCRSSRCVHPQCFDANSWFTMMEQTTTFLCPVCEKALDPKDLIIDGYFDHILEATPDSVDDVIVESDGEWHTSDNKYASPRWMQSHPPPAGTSRLPSVRKSPSRDLEHSQSNGKGKGSNVEIFVLSDDDEDDEGQVKRELSPSYTSSAAQSSMPPAQVIDLTLDSDDEAASRGPSIPPLPAPGNKRTASQAEMVSTADQLWKRGRIEDTRILPPPQPTNGIPATHQPSSTTLPALRYPQYQENRLPPIRLSQTATPPSYPAHNPPFPFRTNGGSGSSSNGRWS